MSIKSFLKSASFKSIIVLLCTLLISGIFLTFANALFYVSPEERNAREIAKIYGEGAVVTQMEIAEEHKNLGNSIIEVAYSVDDGNYLVKATGKGGWGGNIPCWVVVEMTDGKISGIGKVQVVTAETKETFLNKFSDSFYTDFGDKYVDGIVYSPDEGFITSGATLSSTAICNAVNSAITFVKVAVLGEEYVGNPFDNFQYIEYINKDKTVHYVDGETVGYKIVTGALGEAGAFTITVTVGADQTVTGYSIDENGSTGGYEGSMVKNIETNIIGKSASELLAIVEGVTTNGVYDSSKSDSDLTTGATKSNLLCYYAALFATANYEAALATPSTSEEPITPSAPAEPDPTIYDDFQFVEYIDKQATDHSYNKDNGTVTYEVVTTGLAPAGAFTVKVAINSEKIVESVKILVNGSDPADYGTSMNHDFNSLYIGKNAEQITTLLGSYLNNEGTYDNALENAPDEDKGVLNTHATRSNFLVAYSVLFAVSNYDLAVANSYENAEYINIVKTTYEVANGTVTYEVVTTGLAPAGAFTVKVAINSEKVVESVKILVNGSDPADYGTSMNHDINSLYIGKNAEQITTLLGSYLNNEGTYDNALENAPDEDKGVLNTHATRSNFLVAYSVLFAVSNYDLALIVGGAN